MPRIYTQTFCASLAVIERDGKFLLVQETAGKGRDAGKWNTPGGWIDVGEHPIDAVIREVREETGYEFTPTYFIGVSSIVRKDQTADLGATPHPIRLVFTGTISSEPVASPMEDEIADIRWFTSDEIDKMTQELRFSSIKDLVRDYLAGKRYPLELIHHYIQK